MHPQPLPNRPLRAARPAPMRGLAGLTALLIGGALTLGLGHARAASPQPPELAPETLSSGGSLADQTRERIYVGDVAINHITDGRLRVFNARTGRLMGMIATGYAGNFALSADAKTVYVATTYLSRGGRGERTDLLEAWDADTLSFRHEVVLPPRRAQTLNYRGMVSLSANGRFALVQNATPATSITVVDLTERQVASEVQTPGCWLSMPAQSHPQRFSMLCGDGKIATVTLDDQGQVADRQLSEVLFDADADAWFQTAERIGDRYFFLSFHGTLSEVNLGGAKAQPVRSVKIALSPADAKAGWRPGGYQAFAVHPDGQRAVVAMHDQGREGSHKMPAKQLWIIDLANGRRVARLPGEGSASLTFSHNGQRLQALDGFTGAMNVWTWQADRLKLLTKVERAGEAALHLESGD